MACTYLPGLVQLAGGLPALLLLLLALLLPLQGGLRPALLADLLAGLLPLQLRLQQPVARPAATPTAASQQASSTTGPPVRQAGIPSSLSQRPPPSQPTNHGGRIVVVGNWRSASRPAGWGMLGGAAVVVLPAGPWCSMMYDGRRTYLRMAAGSLVLMPEAPSRSSSSASLSCSPSTSRGTLPRRRSDARSTWLPPWWWGWWEARSCS